MKHGVSRSPAAPSTTPRAWPTANAVRTLRPKKMSSTAIACGPVLVEQVADLREDRAEPPLERFAGGGGDHAAADGRQRLPARHDNPVAGRGRARIDAQHGQGNAAHRLLDSGPESGCLP